MCGSATRIPFGCSHRLRLIGRDDQIKIVLGAFSCKLKADRAFPGNFFTASRKIQMFKVGLNYRFGSLFGGGYGGSY